MTIRTRLALGVALQTAIIVLVVAAVQFLALRSFLVASESQRLEGLMPRLTAELDHRPLTARPPLVITSLPRNVDARVVQGGQVVAVTDEFPALPLTLPAGYAPRAGHQVLVAPLVLRGQPATAQIASDVLGVVDPLRAYLRALAVTVPAAALLVALLSSALGGPLAGGGGAARAGQQPAASPARRRPQRRTGTTCRYVANFFYATRRRA